VRPCKCPNDPPRCKTSHTIKDGCGCCHICPRQQGDLCDFRDKCDEDRGLHCDYSLDDGHRGICRGLYLLSIKTTLLSPLLTCTVIITRALGERKLRQGRCIVALWCGESAYRIKCLSPHVKESEKLTIHTYPDPDQHQKLIIIIIIIIIIRRDL